MADYVKGRFHAARVGVTMAILGLLAGLGIKSNGEQPPTTVFEQPASFSFGKNSIGSAQIKNHSIQLGDIKLHQVASYKELKSLAKNDRAWNMKFANEFLKLDTANLLHKIDSYLKIDVYNKAESDAAFLKLDGTAQNAFKIDGLAKGDIIQGHGSVLTGNMGLGSSDGQLFVLIGLLRVIAKESGQTNGADITLENLSSTQTLLVNGDGKGPITIGPGTSQPLTFLGDGSVRTLSIIVQGGSQAITIGLSPFAAGGGGGAGHQLVGQAVIGSY